MADKAHVDTITETKPGSFAIECTVTYTDGTVKTFKTRVPVYNPKDDQYVLDAITSRCTQEIKGKKTEASFIKNWQGKDISL